MIGSSFNIFLYFLIKILISAMDTSGLLQLFFNNSKYLSLNLLYSVVIFCILINNTSIQEINIVHALLNSQIQIEIHNRHAHYWT